MGHVHLCKPIVQFFIEMDRPVPHDGVWTTLVISVRTGRQRFVIERGSETDKRVTFISMSEKLIF